MRFGVLGPLEVRCGGAVVEVGGRQPRAVLTALVAADGRGVPADTLIEALWPGAPPASAAGTVQTYVSRLRKVLRDGPVRIVHDDGGYRLDVPPTAVDAHEFERLAAEGRRFLEAGRLEHARAALREGLGLWRGRALHDLPDVDAFVGARVRLEEGRLAALEDRVAVDLAAGRHAAVVGELTELAAAHPLREGFHAQLALALYRAGRQAEALQRLRDAGRSLREEFGLDPSPRLRGLEAAILRQDPALDAPTRGGPVEVGGPSPTRGGPVEVGDPSSTRGGPVEVGGPSSDRAEGDDAARVDGAHAAAPRDAVPRDAARPMRPPSAGGPGGPALVGRDGELEVLKEALEAARDDARFVVVEGEPGIGKTRLADELGRVAADRGSLVVWCRADESGAAPALWPWLPLLRALRDHHGELPELLRGLLAGDAADQAPDASAQFERFDALAALVEATGTPAPVVVLLDDLQWADASSLELLRFLVNRLRHGVLLVATLRLLEIGRSDAVTDALAAVARRPTSRRLRLRGLAPDDTTRMLRRDATETLDDEVLHRIVARAEGNPFYALELTRLAGEQGGFDGGVPPTVADVIRRRLAILPTPTSELLATAAVTGRDVDLRLLSTAAGLAPDQCVDMLEPAVAHRLLVEVPGRPDTLRFVHALVRETLLAGITSLHRARLHLRIADALGDDPGPDLAEIVAEHLWRAAPVAAGARAAAALERAAEVAVRRVSYRAAERHLQRAARLRRAVASDDDDRRAELRTLVRLLEVTQTTRYMPGTDRATLQRAKELAASFDDVDLLRRLAWHEWAGSSAARRVAEAVELVDEYVALCRHDPRPEVRFGALEARGTMAWQMGRVREAVAALDAAVALLDRLPPPVDAFEAEQRLVGRAFQLYNHAVHGDWPEEEVFTAFDRLSEDLPRAAVSGVCGFAATTAAVLGRYDEVDRFRRRALEADPHLQFAFWAGQARMFTGMAEVRAGRLDDGLRAFADGRRRYLDVGARSGLAVFVATMAMLAAERGALDEATRLAREARDELDNFGEAWTTPVVLFAEGVVAAAADRPGLAAERLASAARVAREQGAQRLAERVVATAAASGIELPRPEPSPSDARTRPLVGRGHELDRLAVALRDAALGHGRLVALLGEAGVGKSRMVAELKSAATARGATVLLGRGVEGSRHVPLRPLSDALLPATRGGVPRTTALAPFLPALSTVVPGLTEGAGAPVSNPVVLGEGLLRLCVALGGATGTVLVLDDLHWADADTLAVVEYLADNVGREPVLVVATARTETPSDALAFLRRAARSSGAELLTLGRLGRADAEALAEAVAGTRPPADVLEAVVRRSEGVPLLVEELAAAGDVAAAIPESYAASIARRTASLAPEAATLLLAGAVLGRKFDPDLAGRAAGLPPEAAPRALETLLTSGLVEGDDHGAVRFPHPLVQEAVLALAVAPRVRDLRRRAAEVLAADASPDAEARQLAADLLEAAGEPDAAANHLLALGRESLAAGALRSAEETLRRARRLAQAAELRRSVDLGLIDALAAGARADDALDLGRRLVRELEAVDAPPEQRAALHLALGEAARTATRLGTAAEHLAAARATAGDRPRGALAARLDVLAAGLAIDEGRADEALELAERALHTQGARVETRVEALGVIGRRERLRDLPRAAAAFERQYALAETHGLRLHAARALQELGTVEMFTEGGTSRLERARTLAAEVGDLALAATVDLQLTGVLSFRFDVPRARDAARRCLELARPLRLDGVHVMGWVQAAFTEACAGDEAAMERMLASARLVRDDDEVAALADGHCRAWLDVLQERRGDALAHLDRAMDRLAAAPDVTPPGLFRGLWVLVAALEGRDGPARLDAVRATDPGNPLVPVVLDLAEAVLVGRAGDGDRAARLVSHADGRLRALRFDTVATLLRRLVAEAALEDDWGSPVAWLQEAADRFAGGPHARVADAARALLRDAGVRRRRRDAEVPEPLRALGLTPREVEVLGLVAARRTNREIADRLVISPRTVEKHVERLLMKTGRSDRRGLESLAAAFGDRVPT